MHNGSYISTRNVLDSNYDLKNSKSDGGKTAWKRTMHVLVDYLEQSFKIVTVVVMAEIIRRVFRILYEYFLCANYYEPENKLLTITKRSLGMNLSALIAFIAYLFGAVVFVVSRCSWPPAKYFIFMPLYWLFVMLDMPKSDFYYTDWIRQSHGLNYAEGMAANYFHGYLKLILPANNDGVGLKERMELYENQHKVKFAIKRLCILLPNTMFINGKIESKVLQKDGVMPLETIIKHRAGVARIFKNDVYRFTHPINGTYYYVALEGATPILSYFDALNFQPTTTWQMKAMSREILFKFYKYLKHLLNKWPETEGKADLILYNSYKSDGRLQDVGEVVLAHITNAWNDEL